MRVGAIDNLALVTQSEKLREFLDGLANPALRRHFQRKLEEVHQAIDEERIFSSEDLMRLFRQVAAANRESVELPNGLLVVEFTEGLIHELDDFTGMIWPADAAEFEKLMMGGFEGIGIQLGVDERTNRLKVITPLENSPALEAGIQPDDLINRRRWRVHEGLDD